MIQLQAFNNLSADFSQTISLGGAPITLRLVWNIRSEFWYLRVSDQGGTTIGPIKVVPNWLLLRQQKALFPVSGDLLLVRENPLAGEFPTFSSLGSDFSLYYLTEEEATQWEDLNGLG